MMNFLSTQMTLIEQINTDFFVYIQFILYFKICENQLNLCYLCAKNARAWYTPRQCNDTKKLSHKKMFVQIMIKKTSFSRCLEKKGYFCRDIGNSQFKNQPP